MQLCANEPFTVFTISSATIEQLVTRHIELCESLKHGVSDEDFFDVLREEDLIVAELVRRSK